MINDNDLLQTSIITRTCLDCGADISSSFPTRKYCLQCGRIRRIKYKKEYRKTTTGKTIKSENGKWRICICPMCRKSHRMRINYTGHGTPRIYCNSCRANDAVQTLSNDTYSQLGGLA